MSSGYPQWWNQTITIYNKYTDSLTHVITWYRHVISGCFWKDISDEVDVGTTTLATNNIICRIPKQSSFLEQYQWVQLPNDKMSKYFTLHEGDIIVRGTVTDEINEGKSGQRSSDFVHKYKELQGCLTVQTFQLNVDGGRNNEHYYVKGE